MTILAERGKVAIIGGAGTVGSTLAFYLCTRSIATEVVLIDIDANRLSAHVMDIEQAVSPLSSTRIRPGGYAHLAGAAIVVIACSKPDAGGSDRSLFVRENLALTAEAASYIKEFCPTAVIITVTNPVDILNYAVWQQTGLGRARCIGFSSNDSLRFRWAIAKLLNVSPTDVRALVIGEHGPNQVPLFSSITVGGKRCLLSVEEQSAVNTEIRSWFRSYIALKSGRTSGWTSAIGATTLIETILLGSGEVVSASVIPEGEYGLSELSIGLPVRIGAEGVLSIEPVKLTVGEARALERASETIRKAIAEAWR